MGMPESCVQAAEVDAAKRGHLHHELQEPRDVLELEEGDSAGSEECLDGAEDGGPVLVGDAEC